MAFRSNHLASVTVSTETDLVVPQANAEVMVLSIIAVNDHATQAAIVRIHFVNSANADLGSIYRGTLQPGDPAFVDVKLIIAASATPNKIRVISDNASTSFYAGWDEG